MKKSLSTLIILIVSIRLFAQNSQSEFENTYSKLIENLTNENWVMTDSLTTYLLYKINNLDSMTHEKKVLRYISIYSTAGLLNEKSITKEKALIKVKKYEGLEMIMPAHPIKKNCYINCTYLASDRKNTLFSGVNNSKGTQIFSFEYIKMKDPIDENSIKKIEGKFVSLKGKLKKVNLEGNMFPRFKMEFINGETEIMDE